MVVDQFTGQQFITTKNQLLIISGKRNGAKQAKHEYRTISDVIIETGTYARSSRPDDLRFASPDGAFRSDVERG